jgi:hypothetical protein
VIAPFLAPGRDEGQRAARAKAGGTTYYAIPGVSFAGSTTTGGLNAAGTGRDFYFPFYLQAPAVIDQLAFEVTTLEAAVNSRIGFYAANSEWQPQGSPLTDSGDISLGSSGVKTYTPGTPIYVPRGRYLGVMASNNAGTAQFRLIRGVMQGGFLSASSTPFNYDMRATRAYAALPTPPSAWTFNSGSGSVAFDNVLMYRISAA